MASKVERSKMKRIAAVVVVTVIVLTGGVPLITRAPGDEADEARAAVLAHWAAWRAGDPEAIAEYYHSEFSLFGADGEPLWTTSSLEEFKNRIEASLDAGYRLDIQTRDLEVKVYGHAAIATSYLVGTTTLPGGETEQGPWRNTSVWIKEGNQWKAVHGHWSRLVSPLPE